MARAVSILVIEVLPSGITRSQALALLSTRALPTMSIGTGATCQERYKGTFGALSFEALNAILPH